jgi:hypothetical protein
MTMTEYHKTAVKLINRQKNRKAKMLVDIAENEDEYFVANKIMERRTWEKTWKNEIKSH